MRRYLEFGYLDIVIRTSGIIRLKWFGGIGEIDHQFYGGIIHFKEIFEPDENIILIGFRKVPLRPCLLRCWPC